ncbi:hypothetical protein ONB71_00835 [Candidatus Purcelliella pentastirinorum]|uniref:YhdP central domain-containing protein n=1 Tax=Candidatus Purcelliella pentastirinorum TaxID=472834 RepID=A0AAX3N8A4_9ENTR|nr:AsmA-like C-terminal region-containing protein [Candidatus Purcelliella pentastirinorum]WDI78671.1 hypothetical protein ONB71_00835 [Candidatus Purcelliella pentastirinorum]
MRKLLKILSIIITILTIAITYIIININLILINLKNYSEIIFYSISKYKNISIHVKSIQGKFNLFNPLIKIKKIFIIYPNKDKILINKLIFTIDIKKTIYNLNFYINHLKIKKLNINTNSINLKKNEKLFLPNLKNIKKIFSKFNNLNISKSKLNIFDPIKKEYKIISFNLYINKKKYFLKNKSIINLLNNKKNKTKIKIDFKTKIVKLLFNIKNKIYVNKIYNLKNNEQKNYTKGKINFYISSKIKNEQKKSDKIQIKYLYYKNINEKNTYFINIKDTKIKINKIKKKIKFNIKYININNKILLKKKFCLSFYTKKKYKNNIKKSKNIFSKIFLYNKELKIKIKNNENIYCDIYINFNKLKKNIKNKIELSKLTSKININLINYNINYIIKFLINIKNKNEFNIINSLINIKKKTIHINNIIIGNTKKINIKIKIEKKEILNSTIFIKNKLKIFLDLINSKNQYTLKNNINNNQKWIKNIINNLTLKRNNIISIKYIKININYINITGLIYKNIIFIIYKNENTIRLKIIKNKNIIEITFNKNNFCKIYIHCINKKINIDKIPIKKININKCWLNDIILYAKNISFSNKKISFDINKTNNSNFHSKTHVIIKITKKHKIILIGNIYGHNIQNLFKYLNIQVPINNSNFFIKYYLTWNKISLNNINNRLNGIIEINLNKGLIKNINVKKIIKKINIKLIFINVNIIINDLLPKKIFFKKILGISKISNGIIYLNNILLITKNENLKINGKIDLNKNKTNIKTIIEPKIYKSIKIIIKLLIEKILKLKNKLLNY